jgi:hypothetical protein
VKPDENLKTWIQHASTRKKLRVIPNLNSDEITVNMARLTFSPLILPRSDVPHTPAAEEFLRKFTTKAPFVRKIQTE